MKRVIFLAALLASVPAFAITANGGAVSVGSNVILGSVSDAQSYSDSGAGAPGLLGAAVYSTVTNPLANVTAVSFANVSAQWVSATQGSVYLNWGWEAQTAASGLGTQVETNKNTPNWTYNFTTGASAASFNVKWTLSTFTEVGSTFGLQGIFGRGSMPYNVTPFTVSPVDGSGSFSVALNPNTAYSFSISNNGNLGNEQGGFDSVTGASFGMDWTITESGVPEPASWAMLLTGFGLVGAGMRRRRHVAA